VDPEVFDEANLAERRRRRISGLSDRSRDARRRHRRRPTRAGQWLLNHTVRRHTPVTQLPQTFLADRDFLGAMRNSRSESPFSPIASDADGAMLTSSKHPYRR
jgi:hypothetical protein